MLVEKHKRRESLIIPVMIFILRKTFLIHPCLKQCLIKTFLFQYGVT